MDVKEAIEKRRSYRALGPAEITDALVDELAGAAGLAASCYNNQPWRFVFVRAREALEKVRACLSKNNDWARRAPLVIAACAARDYDCVIKDREFYLFDLGQSAALLQLRAAELGLVAHPIAGFDPAGVRKALGIPESFAVPVLLVVGARSGDLSALTPQQAAAEAARPPRLPLENMRAADAWSGKLSVKVEH